MAVASGFSSIKVAVLLILCLQNSIFTVLRRYSQGVLKEEYSKHEVLVLGELIKILFSAYMIFQSSSCAGVKRPFFQHIKHVTARSHKMFALSLIYGLMNILSFVALRNISAGIFTICAQLKILTTATFSSIMLKRSYSYVKWRALVTLMLGVLLFSEPVWYVESDNVTTVDGNVFLGTMAVLAEVTLSGFASIYFEKAIKTDPEQMTIWERNFQLALGSFPVYALFIFWNGGNEVGYFGGWSHITVMLALLGAAGGLLVALSIKYADAILKTLATTGAIILSSILDHVLLNGPLDGIMMLAAGVVVLAIFDFSFDPTPSASKQTVVSEGEKAEDIPLLTVKSSDEEQTSEPVTV